MGEFPNRATQFPVNRQNHTKKGAYLKPILEKLLSAEWDIGDKKIKALLKKLKLKETVGIAIVLRRVLNAAEGDDLAIERIFDRIDGKVADTVKHEESQEALMQEEIDLIPSDGNGKINRIKDYLAKNDKS